MIRIISVGKIRESYFAEAAEEYFKRLRKYAKVESIAVKSFAQAFKQTKGVVVFLDENGKQMTSEKFAEFIKDKDISFVIGPAEGFSKDDLKKADYLLSLSKMTFPHQMANLFLIEQVYRAFTILKNEKYHK